MSDPLFQNLSTVQNNTQPTPVTMAAAATIAPSTFLTKVTGTTNVATITPPVTGTCTLLLKFTDASPGDLLTTGNINTSITTVAQNDIVFCVYDPVTAKWDVRIL